MRSADALEKLSARDPSQLQPFQRELWRALTHSSQIEVTWNLSRIVCVMALQAMVDLARVHPMRSDREKRCRAHFRRCERGRVDWFASNEWKN